jgi:hypothetical protein
MTVEQLPANGGLRLRGSVDIGNLLQSFSGILSKVTYIIDLLDTNSNDRVMHCHVLQQSHNAAAANTPKNAS